MFLFSLVSRIRQVVADELPASTFRCLVFFVLFLLALLSRLRQVFPDELPTSAFRDLCVVRSVSMFFGF